MAPLEKCEGESCGGTYRESVTPKYHRLIHQTPNRLSWCRRTNRVICLTLKSRVLIKPSIVHLKCENDSPTLSECDSIFCPECGTLAFPGKDGIIKCPNGRCNYIGEAKGKVKLKSGEEIDTSDTVTSSKASDLKHLREVIDDSSQHRGVLTSDSYICPKCEGSEVFAELKQTRASDEPETRILTCADCSHGWREY